MAEPLRSQGRVARMVLAGLIVLGLRPGTWAEEEGKARLTPEQDQALETLIEGLQTLGTTPATVAEVERLVQSGSARLVRDIHEVESRVETLKKQIAEAETKKAALHGRLNALLATRLLLSGNPRTSTPQSPLPADTGAPPRLSQSGATVAAPPVPASSPETESGVTLFRERVLSTFQGRCIECHGPEKQKSGLRVDSLEALLKEGEYGVPIVPGDPEKSFLIQAIRHDGDVKMPPKEKLPPEDIAALSEWVRLGAPWATVQTPEVRQTARED